MSEEDCVTGTIVVLRTAGQSNLSELLALALIHTDARPNASELVLVPVGYGNYSRPASISVRWPRIFATTA
jgi:hypothetical protein